MKSGCFNYWCKDGRQRRIYARRLGLLRDRSARSGEWEKSVSQLFLTLFSSENMEFLDAVLYLISDNVANHRRKFRLTAINNQGFEY